LSVSVRDDDDEDMEDEDDRSETVSHSHNRESSIDDSHNKNVTIDSRAFEIDVDIRLRSLEDRLVKDDLDEDSCKSLQTSFSGDLARPPLRSATSSPASSSQRNSPYKASPVASEGFRSRKNSPLKEYFPVSVEILKKDSPHKEENRVSVAISYLSGTSGVNVVVPPLVVEATAVPVAVEVFDDDVIENRVKLINASPSTSRKRSRVERDQDDESFNITSVSGNEKHVKELGDKTLGTQNKEGRLEITITMQNDDEEKIVSNIEESISESHSHEKEKAGQGSSFNGVRSGVVRRGCADNPSDGQASSANESLSGSSPVRKVAKLNDTDNSFTSDTGSVSPKESRYKVYTNTIETRSAKGTKGTTKEGARTNVLSSAPSSPVSRSRGEEKDEDVELPRPDLTKRPRGRPPKEIVANALEDTRTRRSIRQRTAPSIDAGLSPAKLGHQTDLGHKTANMDVYVSPSSKRVRNSGRREGSVDQTTVDAALVSSESIPSWSASEDVLFDVRPTDTPLTPNRRLSRSQPREVTNDLQPKITPVPNRRLSRSQPREIVGDVRPTETPSSPSRRQSMLHLRTSQIVSEIPIAEAPRTPNKRRVSRSQPREIVADLEPKETPVTPNRRLSRSQPREIVGDIRPTEAPSTPNKRLSMAHLQTKQIVSEILATVETPVTLGKRRVIISQPKEVSSDVPFLNAPGTPEKTSDVRELKEVPHTPTRRSRRLHYEDVIESVLLTPTRKASRLRNRNSESGSESASLTVEVGLNTSPKTESSPKKPVPQSKSKHVDKIETAHADVPSTSRKDQTLTAMAVDTDVFASSPSRRMRKYELFSIDGAASVINVKSTFGSTPSQDAVFASESGVDESTSGQVKKVEATRSPGRRLSQSRDTVTTETHRQDEARDDNESNKVDEPMEITSRSSSRRASKSFVAAPLRPAEEPVYLTPAQRAIRAKREGESGAAGSSAISRWAKPRISEANVAGTMTSKKGGKKNIETSSCDEPVEENANRSCSVINKSLLNPTVEKFVAEKEKWRPAEEVLPVDVYEAEDEQMMDCVSEVSSQDEPNEEEMPHLVEVGGRNTLARFCFVQPLDVGDESKKN